MLKRFSFALLALTFVLASCSKDNNPPVPPLPPLTGPYASGIAYYGTTYEDVAFYDPAAETFYEGNLFEEANGELMSTTESFKGGINDMWIADRKAWFLTPESSDGSGRARVSITTADTYELITDLYAVGFDRASLGDIYSLVPVGDNKIYISYNKPGDMSGVGVLRYDADGNATFTPDIPGTFGALGVNGPAPFQKFVKHGNYVVVPCGSKLRFIDTATDMVVESRTVEIDPDRQIAAVVKGRDGYLYAIVAGECDKSPGWLWDPVYTSNSSIVKISPWSSQIVSSVDVVVDGQALDVKAAMEANGAAASLTTDEIFFVVAGDAFFGEAFVYKYDCNSGDITLFADPLGGNDEYTFGKSLATDMQGNLYVPRIYYYAVCYPQAYNIDTGALVRDFEEDDEYTRGDGGFVSTWQF
jgi:hypothetical protein